MVKILRKQETKVNFLNKNSINQKPIVNIFIIKLLKAFP